jgi:hypothetical protein
MAIASIVLHASRGEDSFKSGRILAVILASEGIAVKSEELTTALSSPGREEH